MSVYRKNNAKISLDVHFDKSFLFVGDSIKGNIEICSKSTLVIEELTIEIFLSEEWKFREGNIIKSDYYKSSIEFCILDLKKLKNGKIIEGGNILLPPGITFLPFDIPFSEENFPCFEYPSPDKRGFIRYNFEVNLVSPNYNDKAFVSAFLILLSKPIIDSKRLLYMSITQNIKKWKFFGVGDTKLNVNFPSTNFRYDSMCKLDIEIDNTNGKMITKELKFTFKRTINYKNKNGEIKHKLVTKIKRKKIAAVVQPGNKSKYEYNIYLKEKETSKHYNYDLQVTPYNIDLENINFFMPTIKGKLITCDYVIKISLYFESFVDKKHRPRIRFPINLVHRTDESQSENDIEEILRIPHNENTQRNRRGKSFTDSSNNNYFLKEDKQNYLNNKQNMRKMNTNKNNMMMNMGMMTPGMNMMGMMNMGMMNPGMMNMGMMNPGMMNMGMMNPGLMNPGIMTPGMMTPGMNNMNMMNMGMMNLSQKNTIEDDEGWTITYVKDETETTIKISPDKTILEAGNIYKLKTNLKGEMKYKYGDKYLDCSLQLCQSGLVNNATIFVECV